MKKIFFFMVLIYASSLFSAELDSLKPLYDVKKSFEEQYNQAPSLPSSPPTFSRKQKNEWIDFLGFKVASPIGIAACPLMTGKGIELLSKYGYDIFTYKTIRYKSHASHPLPNIIPVQHTDYITSDDYETVIKTAGNFGNDVAKIAIANSFGNGCVAPDLISADIKHAKKSLQEGQLLIVSIYGESPEEFQKAAELAYDAGANIIEANMSCPNIITKNNLNPFFTYDCMLALKYFCAALPLSVKIGYMEDDAMKKMVRYCNTTGVNAITAINSFPMHVVDSTNNPAFGKTRTKAGVSGAPIKMIAREFVTRLKKYCDENNCTIPIIGVGGITTSHDFNAMLKSGAALAQCATAAMFNPNLGLEYQKEFVNEVKI